MKSYYKYSLFILLSVILTTGFFNGCNYAKINYDDDPNPTITSTTIDDSDLPGISGAIYTYHDGLWLDNVLWKIKATAASSGSNYVSDITPGKTTLEYKVIVPTNDTYSLVAFSDFNMNDILDTNEWTSLLYTNGTTNVTFITNEITNIDFYVSLKGQHPTTNTNFYEVTGSISNYASFVNLFISNDLILYYPIITTNSTTIADFKFYLEEGTYDILLFSDFNPRNGIFNFNNNETINTNDSITGLAVNANTSGLILDAGENIETN